MGQPRYGTVNLMFSTNGPVKVGILTYLSRHVSVSLRGKVPVFCTTIS